MDFEYEPLNQIRSVENKDITLNGKGSSNVQVLET